MRIRTNDKELYLKLKSLNYTDEIVIKKNSNTTKIINNINKDGHKLDSEVIGNRFLLKRLKPFNINVYHNKRR